MFRVYLEFVFDDVVYVYLFNNGMEFVIVMLVRVWNMNSVQIILFLQLGL